MHPYSRVMLASYAGLGAGSPLGVVPGAPFLQAGLAAGLGAAPAEWLEPCDAPWCGKGGSRGDGSQDCRGTRPQHFLHWLRLAG